MWRNEVPLTQGRQGRLVAVAWSQRTLDPKIKCNFLKTELGYERKFLATQSAFILEFFFVGLKHYFTDGSVGMRTVTVS